MRDGPVKNANGITGQVDSVITFFEGYTFEKVGFFADVV